MVTTFTWGLALLGAKSAAFGRRRFIHLLQPGKREFVQVLRLLKIFRRDDVVAGIKEAMARGAIGFIPS